LGLLEYNPDDILLARWLSQAALIVVEVLRDELKVLSKGDF
jgi:hypothetical protein